MKPLLEVFTTSWNEPHTIEKLINWYRSRVPDCEITVYDNTSDDGDATKNLCASHNVSFRQFSTDGKMDEGTLIYLRNNAWKQSTAKFVIVCDSDELVDVCERDLLYCNDGEKWNLCQCRGIELFGTDADSPDEFWGCDADGYCKSVLFHKSSVLNMNFAAGSHTCHPLMSPGVMAKWSPIRYPLYHTKWQSWEKGLERQHQIHEKGRSLDSQARGWGFHYDVDDSEHKIYFERGYAKRVRFYLDKTKR